MSAPDPQSIVREDDTPASPGPSVQQRKGDDPLKRSCLACMFDNEEEANQWAAGWWADHPVNELPPTLLTSAEQLIRLLEPYKETPVTPVRLLRGSFLMRRAAQLRAAKTEDERRRLILPRRQELEISHPEAFLTPEQVRGLPKGHSGDAFATCGVDPLLCRLICIPEEKKPLRVVAISHAWLSPKHPDPMGDQLLNFADMVQKERAWFPATERRTHSGCNPTLQSTLAFTCCCGIAHGCCCWCIPHAGQQCCHTAYQFPSGEFAVFYDYCSLVQKDDDGNRTDEERISFSAALKTMGTWYAHSLTTTFSLSILPKQLPRATTEYAERGWTTFERSVSTMIKRESLLTWRRLADMSQTRDFFGAPSAPKGGGTVTPVPLDPEAFASLLSRKAFTNGNSDCEIVVSLYADTFVNAIRNTSHLVYVDCFWTDDEAKRFAEILPLAQELAHIELSTNVIRADGFDAIAAAIESGAAPKLVDVSLGAGEWNRYSRRLEHACHARGIKTLSIGPPGEVNAGLSSSREFWGEIIRAVRTQGGNRRDLPSQPIDEMALTGSSDVQLRVDH